MIHFSGVAKQHGNKMLFQNGNFQINPGEKIGLVGPNGAGKSTIFRLIVGETTPDDGRISKPDRLVVGYYSQDIDEMRGRTVLEEVRSAAGAVSKLGEELQHLEKMLTEPLEDDEMMRTVEKYGELQAEFERLGGYDLDSRASEILAGLGFSQDDLTRQTETFSGGWKMRIALAKILVLNPEVLLMDEPTNHLDIASREALLEAVKNFPGTVMIVSHDRHFLREITTRVFELDHNELQVFDGTWDYYMEKRGRERMAH